MFEILDNIVHIHEYAGQYECITQTYVLYSYFREFIVWVNAKFVSSCVVDYSAVSLTIFCFIHNAHYTNTFALNRWTVIIIHFNYNENKRNLDPTLLTIKKQTSELSALQFIAILLNIREQKHRKCTWSDSIFQQYEDKKNKASVISQKEYQPLTDHLNWSSFCGYMKLHMRLWRIVRAVETFAYWWKTVTCNVAKNFWSSAETWNIYFMSNQSLRWAEKAKGLDVYRCCISNIVSEQEPLESCSNATNYV